MQIRASHILVSTAAEATNLKTQLDGGTDFATLAKQHSACPISRNGGGDLGLFGPGMMVAPFDNAARALSVGSVSGPVQTQFGWHIIKRTA